MSTSRNITLYAKEELGILNPDVITVVDEDEAISLINNTGSRYSTSIFTNSSDIDWIKSVAEIDKQHYQKYGLEQSEIDFIESKIKPME